jgi:hypothetical protein
LAGHKTGAAGQETPAPNRTSRWASCFAQNQNQKNMLYLNFFGSIGLLLHQSLAATPKEIPLFISVIHLVCP